MKITPAFCLNQNFQDHDGITSASGRNFTRERFPREKFYVVVCIFVDKGKVGVMRISVSKCIKAGNR